MKQVAITAVIAFFLLTFYEASAAAAAPANDNFANAQTIAGISGTVTGTTVEATKQAGEYAHAWNRGGNSIWFKYTAPGNGVMTIDTSGSSFNTTLAVYQGPNFSTLHLVAANDDLQTGSVSTSISRVTFGTQAGTDYYLAVDGANYGGVVASGAVQLNYALNNTSECDAFNAPSGNCLLAGDSSQKIITAANAGAGKEANEPDHAGNPGGRSIWYRLQTGNATRSYTFSVESKMIGNPNAGISALFAVYQGSNMNALTPVVSAVIPADHIGRITFNTSAVQNYYVAIDGFDAGGGAAVGNFQITYGTTVSRKQPDFDRDTMADLTVYRPLTGTWYTRDSVTGNLRFFQWGANGDKPLFNHWDDDDRPDYTVFRPDTQNWYAFRSSSQTYTPFSWGIDTDVPLTINRSIQGVSSNFSYATVFRRATGTWWIYTNPGVISYQFGQNGDIPITADFNGDGTDEIAVFRPSSGVWYFANPFTGAYNGFQQFGTNGDMPVPADYDGDGKADLAMFRPSTGTWYILLSTTGALRVVVFGTAGDKPQPADYDGNGTAFPAVFRPSNGTWYILTLGNNLRAVQFGQNGDIPMVAPLYQ